MPFPAPAAPPALQCPHAVSAARGVSRSVTEQHTAAGESQIHSAGSGTGLMVVRLFQNCVKGTQEVSHVRG